MKSRWLLAALPLLVLAVLLGYFAVSLLAGGDKVLPSTLIDRPVPPTDLPALRAGEAALTDAEIRALAAQGPLLVNVFASWCVPCRAEHPFLMDLKKQGVTILALNQRDKPENAKAFLAALGDPFARIGMDSNGTASIEWGVYGVPETFVIDRAGKIRYRHVGAIDAEVLDKTLRPLLKSLGS
ncbi:thiol:disulfide interchange protein [Elstera cyanobacteriorum]|uniref:DsbE family thiol:disulfide interchange protein n=1 Tax=Elstera cyanobacteriorum TaxID=2022747 RepID=A0A255XS91_9PROT|nr:DsbE family thiol:disulfide interchange protein [Elstera cyanobacteriorum]OYQ19782.1 DsbE family thiol:disulfide interchange protein [Elstera cyanobacteriorum]GFZ95543.1 thiol:disulfide interchange protein [Elstera cyanobacteriorum]